MLEDIQKSSLEDLKSDLSQHTRNPMLFRITQFLQYKDVQISEDWAGMNRRRIDFENCNFVNSDLTQTGFAGSFFYNCNFENCIIQNTNFSQCTFTNCKFNCNIESADFCKCKFTDVSFNSIEIQNSNFSDAYMQNTNFFECSIISATWEFCNFKKVNFTESSFSKLNFEFAIFENIHFINTLIPFQSIPFIFGGPQYVLETTDEAYFKSESDGKMTLSAYKHYMQEMLEFYKRTDNLFPTANLLLAYGFSEEGYQVIKDGIIQFTMLRKYRALKYLTYLFNMSKSIPNNRKPHLYLDLFDTLQKISNDHNIDDFDKRTYFDYIRNTLISTDNGGCICSLKTNIDSNDTERIGALYQALEKVTECLDNSTHRIHISHNSEIVMELLVVAVPAVIAAASQIITALISKSKDKNDQNSTCLSIKISGSDLSNDRLQKIQEVADRLSELGINLESLFTIIPPRDTNSDASESQSDE